MTMARLTILFTVLGCTSSAPTPQQAEVGFDSVICDTCTCEDCIDPNPDTFFVPPDAVDATWGDAVFDARECGGDASVCMEGSQVIAVRTLETLMKDCKVFCATATIEVSVFGCVARLSLDRATADEERCLADAVAARNWIGCGRFVVARLTACPK
jgi:hypothetical protein